jgi:hypothetical protein
MFLFLALTYYRMLLIGKRTQSAGGGPNHLSGELTSDTPVHICARNSPCVLQLHHCPSWFPEGARLEQMGAGNPSGEF